MYQKPPDYIGGFFYFTLYKTFRKHKKTPQRSKTVEVFFTKT